MLSFVQSISYFTDFFRKFLYSGFLYKEKRDLEMRVSREAKQKIQTHNVNFCSSFAYTMECNRTIRILIKNRKKGYHATTFEVSVLHQSLALPLNVRSILSQVV